MSENSNTSRKTALGRLVGRNFILFVLMMTFASTLPADERSSTRPNFLVIISDQQHYQAQEHLDSTFRTPNLEALANTAIRFSHAFVTAPQCSPSRASLYTGLYPHKTGVVGNIGSLDANGKPITGLAPGIKTAGAYLKKAGYFTGYIGKWHLGPTEPHADSYDFHRFDTVRGGDGTPDSQKTEHALAFLTAARQKKRPFALFLNYLQPHDIYRYGYFAPPAAIPELSRGMTLPESWYLEPFKEKPEAQSRYMQKDQGRNFLNAPEAVWKTYRGYYRQRVRDFDSELGKVLHALADNGLEQQTIIVVTSDHGDMDTFHRLVYKGPFAYEQLVRVPLLIRVPERFGGQPPGERDALVQNIDLLPTFLDFASAEKTELDGKSLRPLLTGGNTWSRTFVVAEYYNKQNWVHPLRMLRTRNFKYVDHLTGMDELYDLARDPAEIHNLFDKREYQNIKARLSALLNRWIMEENDPFQAQKTSLQTPP